MDKLKNILKFAMTLEKQGENFYNFYADLVKKEENQKLLQNLAEIERSHYLILKKKYDELYFAKELHDIAWVIDTKKIIHPTIFSNAADHLVPSNDEDAFSDLAIMRIAYTIEDDFSNFYRTAAEKITDKEPQDFLLTLAKWEDGHRELFHKRYTELLKASWGSFEEMLL